MKNGIPDVLPTNLNRATCLIVGFALKCLTVAVASVISGMVESATYPKLPEVGIYFFFRSLESTFWLVRGVKIQFLSSGR